MKNKQCNFGSMYIIFSALVFASYGVWSKLMAGYFAEFNQAWIRAMLLLIILVPFGLITEKFKKIAKRDIKWFVIISLAGGLNQAPYFFGFQHLNVGTAALLFYTMLVAGAFLIGKLFFQEKITIEKNVAFILGVVGMLILYSFSLSASQIVPAILTSIAGLLGATAVVFSKKVSSTYSETQILTSMFVAMFLANMLISWLLGESLPLFVLNTPWAAQLGYSAAMLVANALVIAGYKYVQASVGGLLGLLEVIFAAVFGIVFFQDNFTISNAVGGGLIFVAAAVPYLVGIFRLRKGVI
jgi:drug/metabolite transporter (DMT)-like permease